MLNRETWIQRDLWYVWLPQTAWHSAPIDHPGPIGWPLATLMVLIKAVNTENLIDMLFNPLLHVSLVADN